MPLDGCWAACGQSLDCKGVPADVPPGGGGLQRVVMRLIAAMLLAASFAAWSAAARPDNASAWSAPFCGYVMLGDNNWNCTSQLHALNYSSSTYPGSGNIVTIRAGILRSSGVSGSNFSNGASFVSICGGAILDAVGRIAFYDNGANHTMNGHVDDSPNHTGCQGGL